jgi:hypothetical protein
MKSISLCLFVVISYCLTIEVAFAQDAPEEPGLTTPPKYRKSWWGDLGFGWGGQGNAFNFSMSYEVARRRMITLRYAETVTKRHCDEIAIIFPLSNPLGKSARSYEIAYGFLHKNNYRIMNFTFGISSLTIEEAGGTEPPPQSIPGLFYSNCPADYKTTEKTTVGLSVMGQFMPSLRWGGLGVAPYLNINPENVFASLTVNFAFGRIRPREIL